MGIACAGLCTGDAALELAGNVVKHGRPEGLVRCRFAVEVRPDCLVAELSEPGPPVQFTDSVPEGLEESGRGLLIARAVTDELTYRWAGGVSTWRLLRRRSLARPDG